MFFFPSPPSPPPFFSFLFLSLPFSFFLSLITLPPLFPQISRFCGVFLSCVFEYQVFPPLFSFFPFPSFPFLSFPFLSFPFLSFFLILISSYFPKQADNLWFFFEVSLLLSFPHHFTPTPQGCVTFPNLPFLALDQSTPECFISTFSYSLFCFFCFFFSLFSLFFLSFFSSFLFFPSFSFYSFSCSFSNSLPLLSPSPPCVTPWGIFQVPITPSP